jgi:hypothetical protein
MTNIDSYDDASKGKSVARLAKVFCLVAYSECDTFASS